MQYNAYQWRAATGSGRSGAPVLRWRSMTRRNRRARGSARAGLVLGAATAALAVALAGSETRVIARRHGPVCATGPGRACGAPGLEIATPGRGDRMQATVSSARAPVPGAHDHVRTATFALG
jgi:hypothetical protein